MKKSIIIFFSIFLIFSLVSCDSLSQKAGTFAVKFSWAKDADGNSVKPNIDSGEFFVTVRIYEWKEGVAFPGDIAANGKQLIQSDPAQMKATGTSIDFGDLSYGSRRFVVAEIRKGEELTNSVLFTGMSKLFELKAGKHTEVNVEMKLMGVPGYDENGENTFKIEIYHNNSPAERVPDSTVALRFNIINANSIVIANDLNFEKGTAEIALADLKKIDETTYEYSPWDFTTGWEEIGDGTYTVFGKLKNNIGQISEPKRADVFLDTTPPVPNITPFKEVAKLGDIIEVRFSFDEAVDPATLELDWNGLAFELAENKSDKSFTYTHEVNEEDAETVYLFTLAATDIAGNRTDPVDLGKVKIDRTAPFLSDMWIKKNVNQVSLSEPLYLKDSDELHIYLELSEVAASTPVLRIGTYGIWCDLPAGMEKQYQCPLRIDSQKHGDTVADITVSFEDIAGNSYSGTLMSGVKIDSLPPQFTFQKNKTADYNATDTIVLTITANEPVSMIEIDGIEQNKDLTSWNIEGKNETGTHEIKLKAADFAGNEQAEFTVGTYRVDADYPNAVISAPTPDRISGTGSTVITVNGFNKPVASAKLNGTECTGEGTRTCTFEAPFGNGDSVEVLSIQLVDFAGNITNLDAGTVYVDRTPPQIAGDATIVLKKPQGCPLDSVSAVTSGSTVDISFIVNENLSETDPVVRAVNGANVVDFTFSGQIGYLFTYSADIDATDLEDGEYVFEIDLDDEVHNAASVSLTSGFTLDTVSPSPPAVDQHEKIVYRRIPWGSKETGGERYFSIISADNSVDTSGAYVVAFDSDSTTESEIVGKAKIVTETASFGEMKLTVADRKSVYVANYDNSCNYSQPVKVLNVEWTASLNGKILGDEFTNPHSWYVTGNHSKNNLFNEFQTETSSPDSSGIKATGTTYVKNNRQYDMFENEYDSLDNYYTYPMVHDRARGVIVMYAIDSTWEWDGEEWKEIPVDSPPGLPFLKGHALSYNTVSGRTVLFGGTGFMTFPEPYGTWEYDGNKWILVTTEGPQKRYDHSMVYDENRGVVVLYGGYGMNDTWEYENGTWTLTDSDGPSKSGASMFYDPVSRRVLLFGGSNTNEMYEYKDQQWYEILPEALPNPRQNALTVYSPNDKGIILYGGSYSDGSTVYFTDTWLWNGFNWKRTATTGPEFINKRMNMTADPLNGEIVMFRADDADNHVWFYSGGKWYRQETADFKSSGQNVWDENRSRVVKLIYSCGSTFTNPQSCTWEWDGKKWSKVHDMTQGDPGPKSKDSSFNLIYDCVNNRVIALIVDKTTNQPETWAWNGTVWTKLSVAWSPYPQGSASWTCDPANSRVIIWDRGMTVWNGSSWSNPSTTGYPNDIYYQRIAFSPVNSKIYAHGGYSISGGLTVRDDLYVLNNTVWSKVTNTGIFRYNHKMIINPDDGSFIFSSGLSNGNTLIPEVNKWSGSDPILLYYGDYSISGGALRYDSISRKIVVDSGEVFNEISTYNAKPAQIGLFSLKSAQIPSNDSIYEMAVSAYVMGRGWTNQNCTAVYGTFLDVWNNGQWINLSTSYSSSLSKINGVIKEPDLLKNITLGQNELIPISLNPVSNSGCGSLQGSIAVSDPEVTVKYINDEDTILPPYHPDEEFSAGSTPMTWHDARNDCVLQGGDLAVVDSFAKQIRRERLLDPDKNYWIGATDEETEGDWKWVDGTVFWKGNASGYPNGFSNWSIGQPDDHQSAQDYGLIWGSHSYGWDDASASNLNYYICEFK